MMHVALIIYEPRCEKNGLRAFRPGPTQTGLYSQRRWLEACNFVFRKSRDCTIREAKTKALISFAVTANLICVFVLHMQKSGFLITRLIYIGLASQRHGYVNVANMVCMTIFLEITKQDFSVNSI